jgi:predicted RNase H-like HicB family nuclease
MSFRSLLQPAIVIEDITARPERTMHSAKYKIIVEHHEDGFVAYPLGFAGSVTGQGDTADEALADVQSAIRLHMEVFGKDALMEDSLPLNAFITDIHLESDS